MKFLLASDSLSLTQIASVVGRANVETTLAVNNLPRSSNLKQAYDNMCQTAIDSTPLVDWQRKSTLLNKFVSDSDIFETASLTTPDGWKLLSSSGILPGTLKIPESVNVPYSTAILGNGQPIADKVYRDVMNCLRTAPNEVDPGVFNEYSTIKHTQLAGPIQATSSPDVWFKIPWGQVSLYSSLSDSYIDIPVYPEEISDKRSANYTTMPDVLYQYEPWQVYQSSGPRNNTYDFGVIHRDMWTGNHLDGNANKLIRFFQANCYPEYNGSAVNTSTVTLYVSGKVLISGIMTDVQVDWSGPKGLDNWPLAFKLSCTIIEVAQERLDYHSVMSKGLIG